MTFARSLNRAMDSQIAWSRSAASGFLHSFSESVMSRISRFSSCERTGVSRVVFSKSSCFTLVTLSVSTCARGARFIGYSR